MLYPSSLVKGYLNILFKGLLRETNPRTEKYRKPPTKDVYFSFLDRKEH
jgi:hypothetical protein